MSQLLVSVRNVTEANAALSGGADVIDVKEPQNGPLGQADVQTIREVFEHVAGRKPVSAACGELLDTDNRTDLPLTYRKWGPAGCRGLCWGDLLKDRHNSWGKETVVTVAYADAEQANAPSVAEIHAFALQLPGTVFLIDTFRKQPGQNLLTHLSKPQLFDLVRSCHDKQVKIALAGSLGFADIEALLDLQPDFFAVRGAVCSVGRNSPIDGNKVQQLAELVHGSRAKEITNP